MVEEKVKEKTIPKEKYALKEIVTQTDTAIGLVDDDGAFTEKGIHLEILNALDRIEKKLGNM